VGACLCVCVVWPVGRSASALVVGPRHFGRLLLLSKVRPAHTVRVSLFFLNSFLSSSFFPLWRHLFAPCLPLLLSLSLFLSFFLFLGRWQAAGKLLASCRRAAAELRPNGPISGQKEAQFCRRSARSWEYIHWPGRICATGRRRPNMQTILRESSDNKRIKRSNGHTQTERRAPLPLPLPLLSCLCLAASA